MEVFNLNKLFLGQNGIGKTENIKKHIKNLKGRVVILDFSNDYEEITDNVFLLDEINLLESQLNYREMQAINAGYLHDSHCLYRKCIDLVSETDEYKEIKEKYNGDRKNPAFLEEIYNIRCPKLIETTLERLHISWNKIESDYAKILNDKIPKKRSKNHIPMEEAIDKVLENQVIRLQSKTMQSEHQRAVAFALLTRMSYLLDEPFYIIGDDVSSFFNNGNTKLFLEALNTDNVHFIYAFNKPSVLPKAILPTLTEVFFHKIDNNSELKELVKVFKFEEKSEIISIVRKLKIGQYQIYTITENKELLKNL